VPRARILLADDHKEIRNLVEGLLESEFEVVGSVQDGYALLEAASNMKPDLCVVDISMPIISGIDATAKLTQSGARTKIIILTVHEDVDYAIAALTAGASGYVVKSHMVSDLRTAVRRVLLGKLFVSPSLGFGASPEVNEDTTR
jgi:DNA-binding NarL/FixJ family response regulator